MKKEERHHNDSGEGLGKNDKDKLKPAFLDKFLTAGVPHDPKRYLPSFEVAYDVAEQAVRNLSHDASFKEAENIIISKAERIINAYFRQMERKKRIQISCNLGMPPRMPQYEKRKCWICGEPFSIDFDLEMRLRLALNHMPEEFFHLCSKHMMKKYSYYSMQDAVAFRLADRSRPNVGFTMRALRRIGLTKSDIAPIVARAKEYGYEPW